MTPMQKAQRADEARAQFAAVLVQLQREAGDGIRNLIVAEVRSRLDAALHEATRKKHRMKPRVRVTEANCDRWLSKPEQQAVSAPFAHELLVRLEHVEDRTRELNDELGRLAREAATFVGPTWRPLRDAWVSSFNDQGRAASRYASAAAETYADVARERHLPTEVRYRRSGPERYEVWVAVRDRVDIEILRRLEGPTLAVWAARCWSLGVNPRVYFPALPADYEERAGVK